MVYVRLLGPPAVRQGDDWIEPPAGKISALLYHLAFQGSWVRRDELAFLFWPDIPEENARGNLRKTLARARELVFGCALEAERNRMRWNVQTDVAAFRQAIDRGQPLSALQLYAGELLQGFRLGDAPEFETWLDSEREALRRIRRTTLLGFARQLEEEGHNAEAAEAIEPLSRSDPFDEEALRFKLRNRFLAGQREGALAAFRAFEQTLERELGGTPEPLTLELVQHITLAEAPGIALEAPTPARSPAGPRIRHNLPTQTTPFIGRESERRRLLEQLDDPHCRLLTLFAPGGIGKTRLALATAEERLEAFEHGVWFVPLAPLQDADRMVFALADALGHALAGSQDPEEQLLGFLRTQKLLLLLDNLEHLLPDVDFISRILESAPGVKILATSRERLGLQSEWLFEVRGLALPEQDGDSGPSEAVDFFVQTAQRLQPHFGLDPGHASGVTRICRLVEGMPLAIELAAAWVTLLTPDEIAQEITRGIDFLTSEMRDLPARQRSIRAVFDTSWEHLADAERQALMRLSAFRGGFTRHAAQVVADADLRTLRTLLNKAFLGSREGRYDIHELLRQYAHEKLLASGHEDHTLNAHSSYYLTALRDREPDLRGGNQLQAFRDIAMDFENLRAAWTRAVGRRADTLVSAAAESLHLFCDMRYRQKEGVALFQLGREKLAPQPGERPTPAWGRVLTRCAFLRLTLSSSYWAGVESDLATASDIARKAGDSAEIALASCARAVARLNLEGDTDSALPLLEQALDVYRGLGDSLYQSRVVNWISLCHLQRGALAEYLPLIRRALELARESNSAVDTALSLANLAEASLTLGDYRAAERYAKEALDIARALEAEGFIAFCRVMLGIGAFLAGDLDSAAPPVEDLGRRAGQGYDIPVAYALGILGLVASVGGDYATARVLTEKSLAIPTNNGLGLSIARWGLAIAHCGLQDREAAWSTLRIAFQDAVRLEAPAVATWLLPVAAVLLADSEPVRAIELLALATTHPLASPAWTERWPLLLEVREGLLRDLGEGGYAEAWTRGAGSTTDEVVRSLLSGDLPPEVLPTGHRALERDP